MINLVRFLRRMVLMSAFEEGGGGGVAEAPAQVSEPAAPAAPSEPAQVATVSASAVAAPAAKPTMLEAITKGLDKTPAIAGPAQQAPRNPNGQFVPKVAADKLTPEGAPTIPAEPGDDDLTSAPEGLGEKAKQRFERLVSTNKELSEKYDTATRQVEYVRDTFQTHGIKQEQFEQAAGVIGLFNKGDYEGAARILQSQLQQLAVLSGKPLAQVDALAPFPDLRAQVDSMQLTEDVAMELARSRAQQHQQQNTQQREQQTQQAQQQERQAVQEGQNAVDAFCKRMAASDLDYGAVEAQLLPEIANLLSGVAPKDWARAVETQYRWIKKVAGSARQAPNASLNALRPTGHGSPQQAPKSAFEAMWGAPAPR